MGRANSAVTGVDSSYKGPIQELLAAACPATGFHGRYMAFGASAHDPNSGTNKRYVVDLQRSEMTCGSSGLPFAEVPSHPSLVFASQGAIRVVEDSLNGPHESPISIGTTGPESASLADLDHTPRGINAALVVPSLRELKVIAEIKTVA